MRGSIGCRCGADISALHISDYDQPFGSAEIHCPLKRDKARNTELFIHCYLWFYGGDKITDRLHDAFIETIYDFSSCLQCFTLFLYHCFPDIFRNKSEHRIQADYYGCLCLFNVCDQFSYHIVLPIFYWYHSRSIQSAKLQTAKMLFHIIHERLR